MSPATFLHLKNEKIQLNVSTEKFFEIKMISRELATLLPVFQRLVESKSTLAAIRRRFVILLSVCHCP